MIYSAPLPLHSINPTDSPVSRISVVALVVLSDSLCLWRKDPYIPSQPLSVRHLPRPTGLPARCSCQPSDTASQRRKSVPTIRAVRGTPASASVLTWASSPARKYVLGLYQWQRNASYGYRLQMLLTFR